MNVILKKNKQTNKQTEKWGRGVNCEEEMREKNDMGEGGCMCVVGGKKREGGTWVVGKIKGNKKEKRNWEWGLRVLWEKMGSEKERRKKI